MICLTPSHIKEGETALELGYPFENTRYPTPTEIPNGYFLLLKTLDINRRLNLEIFFKTLTMNVREWLIFPCRFFQYKGMLKIFFI